MAHRAYAKCGEQHPVMLTTMAREVIHELDLLNTKSLSNIAWAYAKLDHKAPYMFQAISAELQYRGVATLSPIDISHTVWACAKLGVRDEKLLVALARATEKKLDRFAPQVCASFGLRAADSLAAMRPPRRYTVHRVGCVYGDLSGEAGTQ